MTAQEYTCFFGFPRGPFRGYLPELGLLEPHLASSYVLNGSYGLQTYF